MDSEDGGDINDSVDCILRNFVEMNRLWIRMQTTKSHNKELREKERRDLRVLVGMNLSVLSNLEGIDSEYYCNVFFCFNSMILLAYLTCYCQ